MPHAIQVKTILNKTKKRDSWFLDDYTINPYSGCSFNCLYCYIRGSIYGLNMADKLSVKANAIEVLDRQLHSRAKKKQYGIIVLSSATDPYLQFEKEQNLTRDILKVILAYRFPVHIITKSDLVIRDLDLLEEIDRAAILPADLQNRLGKRVFVSFSFSTTDDAVAKIFEPGATPPSARLKTLKQVLGSGFHAGVNLIPLLPYVSDTRENLDKMFGQFAEAGARYLYGSSISLFGSGAADSKTLVLRAIEKHYPQLLSKYHKFFTASNSMPAYYASALDKKIRELCNDFGIPNGIMESFRQ